MRIGLISGEYTPMQGGVADFTRELGKAFVRAGHGVFVLTDESGIGEGDPGVEVCASVRNWNLAALWRVRRWAQANRLDVVNLQYQTAAYNMAGLVHLIPWLLGDIPCVVTFHDLRVPYLFPKAGALRERAVLALARHADAVIVTNPEDEQQLLQAGGVGRLCRIPIGSNIPQLPREEFDRDLWRARLGIGPEGILIGYFGFLNRSKGVDTLLRALAQVGEDDRPVRLLMLGGRTGASDPTNLEYADEIDDLIEALGLTDRVLWTGYIQPDEVSGYLYACDFCVLPYRDGVSFRRGTFMATLAHHCAIITTRPAVPTPELVDGENVLLVPPDSVSELARAMQALAAQPELRARLAAGTRTLADRFAWQRIAAETLDLFAALR